MVTCAGSKYWQEPPGGSASVSMASLLFRIPGQVNAVSGATRSDEAYGRPLVKTAPGKPNPAMQLVRDGRSPL